MKQLLAILLVCSAAFAAAPTTVVWSAIRTATAANALGSGFDLGSASFNTDLACSNANTAAPTCSSTLGAFITGGAGTGDVGAWLFAQSGTGLVAYRACKIASVSGGVATLTATAGTCIDFSSINGKATPSTTAGIGTTGSTTSGVYGIMYNFQDVAQAAMSNFAINGADNTKATGTGLRASMIGNAVHVISGAGCTVTSMGGVWFMTAYSAGTATFSGAMGTVSSTCVANLGGAWSLGSSTSDQTDAQALALMTASATHANRLFQKYDATATSMPVLALGSTSGNAANPLVLEGFNTIPGDSPSGVTAPTWDQGATIFTLGNNWEVRSMNILGSSSSVLTTGTNALITKCKVINYSTTAGRAAINSASNNTTAIGNELVSYRGNALLTAGTGFFMGNYIHDSNNGVSYGGTPSLIGNLIVGNVTAAISGVVTFGDIIGNTLYGAANKLGIGLSLTTASTTTRLINNIIYGFVTPISQADAGVGAYTSLNNDLYNNTNASSNWVLSSSDLAVDPQFTSVTQVTNSSTGFGVGTCGASDNTLTVSGASPGFVSAGVTAGRDYVYLVSGTNVNATKYGIVTVAATTLVLDSDCSSATTASNIAWQITLVRDFGIGANLKGAGWPGVFPQSAATSYVDIGAIQAQGTGGGGQRAYGESR